MLFYLYSEVKNNTECKYGCSNDHCEGRLFDPRLSSKKCNEVLWNVKDTNYTSKSNLAL